MNKLLFLHGRCEADQTNLWNNMMHSYYLFTDFACCFCKFKTTNSSPCEFQSKSTYQVKSKNVCGKDSWVLDFVHCVVLWKRTHFRNWVWSHPQEKVNGGPYSSDFNSNSYCQSLKTIGIEIPLLHIHVGPRFHLLSWEENRLFFRNYVFFPEYRMMDRVQKTVQYTNELLFC